MESLFNVVEIAAIADAIAIRDHINKKLINNISDSHNFVDSFLCSPCYST